IRTSAFNSKSRVVPPRHMMNEFALSDLSGVISPTNLPSSTRHNAVSPSQPASVLPSKIGTNPLSSSLVAGASCCCAGPHAYISSMTRNAVGENVCFITWLNDLLRFVDIVIRISTRHQERHQLLQFLFVQAIDQSGVHD